MMANHHYFEGIAVRTSTILRLALAASALSVGISAQADSFASSASSAGSKSSGSVSDSLSASSNSVSGGNKTATGPYRIVDIAQTPDRADRARLTLQGDEPQQRIMLDLPKSTFDQQQLDKGDIVYAQNRVYGIEFARNDTRKAFYLVLADEWHGEMAPRPVGI
jgi:hypothetical protein